MNRKNTMNRKISVSVFDQWEIKELRANVVPVKKIKWSITQPRKLKLEKVIVKIQSPNSDIEVLSNFEFDLKVRNLNKKNGEKIKSPLIKYIVHKYFVWRLPTT